LLRKDGVYGRDQHERETNMSEAEFKAKLIEATTKFEIALSSLIIEAAEKRMDDACKCKHCISRLQQIETQSIPTLEGQIAMNHGLISTL
jgi:hypothetical protein